MKLTGITTLLLSATLCICGCNKHDSTAAGPASPPTAQTPAPTAPTALAPTPAPTAPKADFTVTAKALLDELKANPDATAAKYKDKTVQVSGVIASLDSPFNGSAVLRLDGGPMEGIECWINTGNPWGQIALGQQITLRGTADLSMMKRIGDCTIIDAGPSTAITTTAQAMTADYQAGADAFEKKYNEKTVKVTGVVLKKGAGKYGGTVIWLKGAGDLNVGCSPSSSPADTDAAGKVNVGDSVTFIGTCHTSSSEGEWLTMAKVLK